MKQKLINALDLIGFTWLIPLVRLATREEPGEQIKQFFTMVGLPVIGLVLFFVAWGLVASNIKTSVGKLPGPAKVWSSAGDMLTQHKIQKDKRAKHYEKEAVRKQKYEEKFPGKIYEESQFSGSETIVDYIRTSLITVFFGFFMAVLIAVPLGVLCGLSKNFTAAINPIIQLCRPVSPLAWVLIVIVVVDGLFSFKGDIWRNTFLHAAITVCLCSLWATLSNTALGVSAVAQDHLNVARVLNLSPLKKVWKIILPSAVPYIFTGMRITLGIGWMVLIVSEMMASQKGLGHYIDLLYQNNNNESLAKIIVCIFIIGSIGFLLDRSMFVLQRAVSFGREVSA